MKARVIVAGHALHAQLIVFPLGLLGISILWDILRLTQNNPMWGVVAYWTVVAGVGGALVAAVPGFIDYLGIPGGTRAKSIGTLHMVLNLIIVGLFAISLVLRTRTTGGYEQAGLTAMLPGWVGVGLAIVSGWLGGELVERLGIGVHDNANPDAPSSLTGRGRKPERPAEPAYQKT